MSDELPQPKRSGDLRIAGERALPTDDASAQALSEALGSSFILVRILMFALLAAFVLSCVFTVNPNEVAVVLRFGRPVGVGPDMIKKQGLHWAFPYPIDEVVKIRNGEALTLNTKTAWYMVTPEEEAQGIKPAPNDRLRAAADGHVLTGDGNILHARAMLKYRIADPVAYTFNFGRVSNFLASALDNSIYSAAARSKADGALYKDKEGFRELVRAGLEKWIIQHKLGVTIDSLEVQTAAPLFVEEAFDAVIKVEQLRSTEISKATGDADEMTRKAVGEAQELIARGNVASNSLIQSVTADADSFVQRRVDFKRNPELFRTRLLAQSFERILTNANDKFFVNPKELRIQLNREPQAPTKTPAGGPPAN